jgi:hypothetical protein
MEVHSEMVLEFLKWKMKRITISTVGSKNLLLTTLTGRLTTRRDKLLSTECVLKLRSS